MLNLEVDIHAQRIPLLPHGGFHRHVAHTGQALQALNRRSQFCPTMNGARLPIHNMFPYVCRQPPHDWLHHGTLHSVK